MSKYRVIVIGAGLSGLSATLTLAKRNVEVLLVSNQPSERSQSVMAEGGINASMDTMGEDDSPQEHAEETLKSAMGIVDPQAVIGMTQEAPNIVRRLLAMGTNFNMLNCDEVDLRNFGGQRKKRTVFAQNHTGKQIMSTLIDAVRLYEVRGIVTRYPHHDFVKLLGESVCYGCMVADRFTSKQVELHANMVIMACGGLHGLFENTTGSMFNTGHAQAVLFAQGVEMSNLEMVQYHPTTVDANGKRMLISEAVRAEGGRLYSLVGGKKRYFMEEKYPTLGNLMPRDITSREIYSQLAKGKVFLDTSNIPKSAWDTKLSEMRKDVAFYLGIDPAKHPIEVAPSIHYFMGGIRVDRLHRTNVSGLLAVGECACQYHGANRLGGNSLLGAIYGGMVAGQSNLEDVTPKGTLMPYIPTDTPFSGMETIQKAMGIVRNSETLKDALTNLETSNTPERLLCKAMLKSALLRTESRGSHFREDYPKTNPKLQKVSVAVWDGKSIEVSFQTINGGESA